MEPRDSKSLRSSVMSGFLKIRFFLWPEKMTDVSGLPPKFFLRGDLVSIKIERLKVESDEKDGVEHGVQNRLGERSRSSDLHQFRKGWGNSSGRFF
jgi:hypothetical protein